MKLKNIKAVIFDWAGTIVDFGCMAPVMSFVEVLKAKGIELPLVNIREFMGIEKKEHLRHLLDLPLVVTQWENLYGRQPDEAVLNELFAELEPSLLRIVGEYARPIPGAVELFAVLRQNNIKIGSATGYSANMMKPVYQAAREAGLEPDCLVTPSEVPSGRPHPWMCYLNTLKLEVYPLSAMVKIGDTVADIKEGLNAGMWTIGVSMSGNETGLSKAEADQMPIDELSRLVDLASEKLYKAGAHYVVNGVWDSLNALRNIDLKISEGEKS